jgi:hypothetical protein
MNKQKRDARVIHAAEEALADHRYVTAIDIFTRTGILSDAALKDWREGRVTYLERVIQGSLNKISDAMRTFRRWARERGLHPSETPYVRRTRGGKMDLRFSKSGNPNIERAYRTHYLSRALAKRKQQKPAQENPAQKNRSNAPEELQPEFDRIYNEWEFW